MTSSSILAERLRIAAEIGLQQEAATPKIITSHCLQPDPDRSKDHEAHYEGHEEIGSGHGPTKEAAIADLIENYEARA